MMLCGCFGRSYPRRGEGGVYVGVGVAWNRRGCAGLTYDVVC